MAIYKIDLNNKYLDELQNNEFTNEREIQDLCESNLDTIFGYDLIATEYSIKNFRIDTLAYDSSSNSLVIIEYKNRKSFSVIDQGYTYLSLLLNNKSEFLLKYIEKTGKIYNKNDIDWSQSKVLFVSPFFNNFQIESINFKNLPFELWEVLKYNDEIITFNKVNTNVAEAELLEYGFENTEQKTVNDEIRLYSEKNHLDNLSEENKELYSEIKERLLNFGPLVSLKVNQRYIAYFNNKNNFCNIVTYGDKIRIIINMDLVDLDDPKKYFKKKDKIGGYALGTYELVISEDSELDYIFSCIKQAFNEVKNSRNRRGRGVGSSEATELTHLDGINDKIVTLYRTLKESILSNGSNVDVRFSTNYIAFSNGHKTFVSLVINKNKIRVYLNMFSELLDEEKLFRKVPRTGGYATGNYDIDLVNESKLDYVLKKIKYAYNND
jgi:predicted transport protein